MIHNQYAVEHDLESVYQMVHDMERHLYTFHTHDNQLPTDFYTLSVGNVITLLNRLDALQTVMGDDQRTQLGNIVMIFEMAKTECKNQLAAALKQEIKLHIHAIQSEMQQPTPNLDVLQFHRTVLQECMTALAHTQPNISELKVQVDTIDGNLEKLLPIKSCFYWQTQLESAYPEGAFWWLYRSPTAEF